MITQLQSTCPVCGVKAREAYTYMKDSLMNPDLKENWAMLECGHNVLKGLNGEFISDSRFDLVMSNDWMDEVKNCKHEFILDSDYFQPNQCIHCNQFKPYDFQIETARFVEKNINQQKGVLVAHDFGLGKTLIGLLEVRFHTDLRTPTLYVVKSKTKFQWLKAILMWIGPTHLGQIIQTSKDSLIPGFKSYITSYDLLKKLDRDELKKLNIKCVVLDECQQIKNVRSARTQQIRLLLGGDNNLKVIALSGTPWKNRGEELFPVLNIIDPLKFNNEQAFLTRWVDWYMHGNQRKQGGIRDIARFKEFTKDLIIRFEFDEVMKDAAKVKRMKLPVQLDTIAQESYDEATSDFVKWYQSYILDGTESSVSSIEILAQMARMRHITGLAKIAATVEFCDEFYENTDRSLVIFVHHHDVGKTMVNELKELFKDKDDVVIETLSASKTDVQNNDIASRFNTDGKRWFIIASTLACGEGIDGLQKGYDAILHERQWNPANEDQAVPGRFKRIGQKSPIINVTCVEADDTIDIDLDAIVEQKRKIFHELMNKGETPQWQNDEVAKELASKIVERWKKKGKKVTKKVEAKVIRNNPVAQLDYALKQLMEM
jgi:SNF2 family DNA or RNA helicase